MHSLSDKLSNSSDGPMPLMVQIINVLCLLAIGLVVLLLRRRFSPQDILFSWLAPALALWIIVCSFGIRYESHFYLPYDLPAVLFFSVGLLACISDWPVVFMLTMVVGTFNRETTLFLLPIWLVSTYGRSKSRSLALTVTAFVVWVLIRIQIQRLIGHTNLDQADLGYEIPWRINLRFLLPHHLFQVFSALGFLAIPLWLQRHLVKDPLLKRVWLGHIPCIAGILLMGWWNETRIFGELTALAAVTAAIEFEQFIRNHFHPSASDESVSENVFALTAE